MLRCSYDYRKKLQAIALKIKQKGQGRITEIICFKCCTYSNFFILLPTATALKARTAFQTKNCSFTTG